MTISFTLFSVNVMYFLLSSGLVTTGLIDSLLASQTLPVAQGKKSRIKKKESTVRYIRNNSQEELETNITTNYLPRSSSDLSLITEPAQPKESPRSLLLPTTTVSTPTNNMTLPSLTSVFLESQNPQHPSSINNKPPMSREQFYKIRPKIPKIPKHDPRRLYATYFAKAYNSCDFQQIWDFLMNYCTTDILFIQRWVGDENYFNFPKYLEVREIAKIAEYWFSRCVIIPDVVCTLKETKLYVRSDGLSTVLSSFSISCTRLYDGEVSDAIVCQSFIHESKRKKTSPSSLEKKEGLPTIIPNESQNSSSSLQSSGIDSEKRFFSTEELLKIPQSLRPLTKSTSEEQITAAALQAKESIQNDPSQQSPISYEPPEQISNRVFEKMKTILLAHMANERKELIERAQQDTEHTSYESLRKKIEEEKIILDQQQEKIRLFEDESMFHLHFITSDEDDNDDDEEEYEEGEIEGDNSEKKKKTKKRKLLFPKDRSVTILGTLTLHLNQDYKIRQLEITFALRK